MARPFLIGVIALGFLFAGRVFGTDLAVIQGAGGGADEEYFYGGSRWVEVSESIDGAFGSVTVLPDMSDINQLLSFDRLWVDQRWIDGSLTSLEVENLVSFIDTGRRVVMIGENGIWAEWNQQILGTVGGSFLYDITTVAAPLDVPPLTDGVGLLKLARAGIANAPDGATPLFDLNWSTLWGDNVVSVLDVNVWSGGWSSGGDVFGQNVAAWLAAPAPGSLATLAVFFAMSPRRRVGVKKVHVSFRGAHKHSSAR